MFCLGQYKPTINRKLMYVNKLDFSSSQHFQLGNLKGEKTIHDKNVKVCLTTDLQYIFFPKRSTQSLTIDFPSKLFKIARRRYRQYAVS